MTLEEFDNGAWTGGIELRYCTKNYKVVSVDFETKSACLERENDETFTVNYKYVEFADTCIWEHESEEHVNLFASSCGYEFEFIDERDNLSDYDFNFCPKCGAKIKEI